MWEGLHRCLAGAGLRPLEVRTGAETWVVGEPDGAPPEAVDLSQFELFRALTGRRSRAQIARYGWTCGPAPSLAAFEFGTVSTRTTDLVE